MPYQIAGIDVHKKMLAVVVADVEVEGDRSFVPVDGQEVRTLARRVERRTPPARVVAGARTLDLDDVSAQIAENH